MTGDASWEKDPAEAPTGETAGGTQGEGPENGAGTDRRTKKGSRFPATLMLSNGRHDWIRTNDPYRVKVVLSP